MSGRAVQPGGLHLVAALADEYGELAERTGNGDLAALVVQLRAVLDLDAERRVERCTKGFGPHRTCVQAFAEGWILASDLCPRCTRRFMAALESAAGEDEPLAWHRNYLERAEPGGGVRLLPPEQP